MDFEVLIELVKNHREIYDIEHKNYCDNQIKDEIWNQISVQLGFPVWICKKNWVSLRDSYRRAIQRRKRNVKNIKNGKPAKKLKKWRYEDQMSFIPIPANLAEMEIWNTINDSEIEEERLNPEKNISSKNCTNKNTNDLMKYILENNRPTQKVDSIDAFLLGIGATLKTLTPYNQNIAKTKIFSIVSEIEMQEIDLNFRNPSAYVEID